MKAKGEPYFQKSFESDDGVRVTQYVNEGDVGEGVALPFKLHSKECYHGDVRVFM